MDRSATEADRRAVGEVVKLYYDGMMAGDAAKLRRAFHPRASIVGNEGGALYWATLDEFIADCIAAAAQAGPPDSRVERLSLIGDTALVTLGGQYTGVWYSDDLSLVLVEGEWRIVHKTFYTNPGG